MADSVSALSITGLSFGVGAGIGGLLEVVGEVDE
jgi:hypothetical protein